MDITPTQHAVSPRDADGDSPPPSANSANKPQQKRTSRACLACRARKSKCTLDSQDGNPHPPCQRCKRESKDCIIGSSNRGGRRIRRATLGKQNGHDSGQESTPQKIDPSPWSPHAAAQEKATPTYDRHVQVPQVHDYQQQQQPSQQHHMLSTQHMSQHQYHPQHDRTSSQQQQQQQQQLQHHHHYHPQHDRSLQPGLPRPHRQSFHEETQHRNADMTPLHMNIPPPSTIVAAMADQRSTGDDVPFNDLQNPSDALDILAHIASSGGKHDGATQWQDSQPNPAFRRSNSFGKSAEMPAYRPLQRGALTVSKLVSILDRYHRLYHPYFPLVPRETLDPSNLPHVIEHEPHLLTAILVVTAKDMIEEPHIFDACATHMQELVSALAAGGPGGVEAVEALLVLAEWTPYTSRSQAGQVGRGEEDREAWMHVGLCLRLGYFLGLDKYSFHIPHNNDPQALRKRLVWTACFISDRQISIRIGRGFWSRGPGPLTSLKKEDFESLRPQRPGEDDYANIFQATLELTALFSNVHDVLYSNPSGVRSHLSGGYIKFIDDFRSAIYGWNSVYGTLTCSQNVKATLLMSYDYLRLYTNAFAFHATIQRALPKNAEGKPQFSKIFHNNIGAVGDARFIYEGLDAAKSLLTTMTNFVDADKSLRYMPLRFYLYCVYAGVFLYRARTVGVMNSEEDASVKRLVSQTVAKLEQAAVGEAHPGFRYSQLLRLLWDRAERRQRKDAGSIAAIIDPYRPGGIRTSSVSNSNPPATPRSGSNFESPAMQEQMGNFSWADLNAVGNFAVNGHDGGIPSENDWWTTGFLPADNNPFTAAGQHIGQGGMNGWGMQMQ